MLSTMVFTQQTGLKNLYSIVDYCLKPSDCRRKMIASYFDETWESTHCNEMCDHSKNSYTTKRVNILKHCLSLLKILSQAHQNDVKLTAQMLVDVWYGKTSKIKSNNVCPPSFARKTGERIIVFLLIINKYLKENFHFTPYSTISYIKKGPKADSVKEGEQISMNVHDQKSSNCGGSNVNVQDCSKINITNSQKRQIDKQNINGSKSKRSKVFIVTDSESD